MARAQRAPRVLKTTEQIEAEAKAAAIHAAVSSNEAIVNEAIDKAIRDIRAAGNKAEEAQTLADGEKLAATGKREAIMIALAKLAHEGGWTEAMVDTGLDAAFEHHYADYKVDGKFPPVGTVATIRSELKRATNEKIRFQLPAILKPWQDAIEAEDAATKTAKAAKVAKKNLPATPLRTRFGGRHQMLTQAMTLAIGKDDDTPFVPAATEAVHTWVREHPRAVRGATPPTATATATTNADGTPKSARKIAIDEVEAITAAVRSLSKKYSHAADLFKPVIEALSHCTGLRLVPDANTPTPIAGGPAAPPAPPAPPPAEPVQGAADLDDAIGEPIAALRERVALMREMKELSGK